MKLEILNIDTFSRANQLEEVTDPIFLEAGTRPTEKGLFSNEIFGLPGSDKRKNTWGIIKLNSNFFHPLVYKTLLELDKKISEIIIGTRSVRVGTKDDPKPFMDAEPGTGWTGIKGFYANWDKIIWLGRDEEGLRQERLSLLSKLPRKTAFIQSWPVMPAVYRDLEPGRGGKPIEFPPINTLYRKLIAWGSEAASARGGQSELRAQQALLEIMLLCLNMTAKKEGIIQDRLLGKYVENAVQGVISTPPLASANSPLDQQVPFGTIGVPLYLLLKLFQPFIIKSLEERFSIFMSGQANIRLGVFDDNNELTYKNIEVSEEVSESITINLFEEWIRRFMRDKDFRFHPLSVTLGNKEEFKIPLFDGQLSRETTMTDLFFRVTDLAIRDKYCLFTRYPVEHFQSVCFAKPIIVTTEDTTTQEIDNDIYKFYPVIKEGNNWIESIRIANSYTEALGADFDGDRIRVFGLWSQEANQEAEQIIRSPKNFAESVGKATRKVKNEAVLSLFSLTR